MMTHEVESEVNAIGVKEINGCCWTIFVLLCICCLNLLALPMGLGKRGDVITKNISMAQSSLAPQ